MYHTIRRISINLPVHSKSKTICWMHNSIYSYWLGLSSFYNCRSTQLVMSTMSSCRLRKIEYIVDVKDGESDYYGKCPTYIVKTKSLGDLFFLVQFISFHFRFPFLLSNILFLFYLLYRSRFTPYLFVLFPSFVASYFVIANSCW